MCTRNDLIECSGRTEAVQPAFELDNWTLNEVRFLSSITLGNGPQASIRNYPLPVFQDFFLPEDDYILSEAHLLRGLIEKIGDDQYLMGGNSGLVASAFSDYQTIDWSEEEIHRAKDVWQKIDVNDDVLVRGLHSLQKSEMLFSHFQFRDASLSASHIALDALHACVISRLKNSGRQNPSSYDAQKYIEDIHGWPNSGRKFFEDYYADRIRNFHADNRYGTEAIPFFSIDDIWHLNEGLKEVYFTLITGEVYAETKHDVDAYLTNKTRL